MTAALEEVKATDMDSGDQAPLTAWRARTMRRAGTADLAYGAAVLALAAITLWSGRAASRHLSPEGARSVSGMLDELELPRVLPNAVLASDDGASMKLWDLAKGPRAIVTFYAPWCAPCQEELPMLVAQTSDQPGLLTVVVGADEDPAEVRKQLDNLGLRDLRFHIDAARELEAGGRVTALPTTFLIGRLGRVQQRIVGYSQFGIYMLLAKAKADGNAYPAYDE
jgi:thiol-disulfide isomerase/thioredoxin